MFCEEKSLTNSNNVPEQLFVPTGNCTWKRGELTVGTYAIYAFVVPVLSTFGLCANFMNAIVFMRPKMTPSAFSYLAALAWLDCFSCLLITLTALSRSVFNKSIFWMTYDFQWQIPLFGISTGAANLLLAGLSCDRWIYLRHGISNGCGQPRFCRRKVARRIIVVILIVAVLLNIPYFFVFVVNNDGTLGIRELYVTTYYKIHNWFSFILLSLLPAIFLIIGHIAIIIAFRRWTKQSRICRKYGNCNAKTTQRRYQHQMKLTITIIILIVLYMIGEMPAALTSRKSSLNLLFGGDIKRVDLRAMARIEMVCLTLNALQLSMNILVYALINPSFMPELFICLRGATDFCCKMCCLMPLIRYLRCKPKKVQQVDVNNAMECGYNSKAGNPHTECDEARKTVHKPREVRSEDINGSENSNWDTEPEDATGELDFDFNQYCSTSAAKPSSDHDPPKSSQVWSTDISWNPSNSFGVYVYDNLTLEVSSSFGTCKITHIEKHRKGEEKRHHKNSITTKQVKRHSLAH